MKIQIFNNKLWEAQISHSYLLHNIVSEWGRIMKKIIYINTTVSIKTWQNAPPQ